MCGLTAKALPKNMINTKSIEIVDQVAKTSDSIVPVNAPAGAPKRKVHFHGIVQVILIPSIQDYRDAHIFDQIWWVASDYREFQLTMSVAFRKFIAITVCPNLKEALKMFIADELEGGSEARIVPEISLKRAVEHIVHEGTLSAKRAKI